ncbi:HNH endonuclease [Nocardia sp. NPDC056952]|uniref:HNH endonuclease n=1 Tax=Nocardia sp. NPDC056952 TaxID=3345979 RepID=UPI00363BDFE9
MKNPKEVAKVQRRDAVPAEAARAVLVEAGHRCAIPTCRTTTTEFAHIVPWAQTQDDSFENLIALCPNCHTRFDQKKEIDRKSIRMYKQNLSILNNRYGELERKIFSTLSEVDLTDPANRVFILGAGGDLMIANAVKDGLFEDKHVEGIGLEIEGSNGVSRIFQTTFTYWVSDIGVEFIGRMASGEDIA